MCQLPRRRAGFSLAFPSRFRFKSISKKRTRKFARLLYFILFLEPPVRVRHFPPFRQGFRNARLAQVFRNQKPTNT
jgi:hypothetical protein